MSMQIDSANYLRKFVRFVDAQNGNGDAIARFGTENDPRSWNLVATDQDHLRGIFNWKYHGEENAAANNRIRQHFILNVLKCLGWDPAKYGIREDHNLTQDEIKEAVNTILKGSENKEMRTALLDALKVKDYGCGKPLTARRIDKTIGQVKKILENRVEHDDFCVIDDEGREFMSGSNVDALTALGADRLEIATPGGDAEPMGGDEHEAVNVGMNGVQSFVTPDNEEFERTESKDELSEDDEDLDEDNADVKGPVNAGVKNVSDEKVQDPKLIDKIGKEMKDFFDSLKRGYLDRIVPDQIVPKDEDTKLYVFTAIRLALEDFKWTQEMLEGDLDAVLGALKSKVSELFAVDGDGLLDDNGLREIVTNIFKEYNYYQRDNEKLRIVIS